MAKLIILVGLPGSGKSWVADEILYEHQASHDRSEAVIHSSDAIRAELFGDPGSQQDNGLVFDTMHKRVRSDLRAGKTVIYDATNITRKARRSVLALADKDDYVECRIVWAPLETCIRRDSERDRHVGVAVIDKMIRRWQSPDILEGFDDIQIINTDTSFDHVRYISSITSAMHIPHDNRHHTYDVWNHSTQAYFNLLAKNSSTIPDAVLQAAYWHDLGKPYTKFFKLCPDSSDIDATNAHYYDHQNVGAYLAYGLFMITGHHLYEHETRKICWISWLINNHMEPFFNSKYYNKLPADERYWIDLIHEADLAAH